MAGPYTSVFSAPPPHMWTQMLLIVVVIGSVHTHSAPDLALSGMGLGGSDSSMATASGCQLRSLLAACAHWRRVNIYGWCIYASPRACYAAMWGAAACPLQQLREVAKREGALIEAFLAPQLIW